jgi:hypothetical protein
MPRLNAVQRWLRKMPLLRKAALIFWQGERKSLSQTVRDNELSFLSLIGQYVKTWAGVERYINEFIIVYHPDAPKKMKSRGLPSTLNEKIQYLSSVASDDRLAPFLKEHLLEWVARIGKQRDFRHLMIHGIGFRRRSYFEHEWNFQKLTIKGDREELERKTVTITEFHSRLKEIQDIQTSLASVLKPILFET